MRATKWTAALALLALAGCDLEESPESFLAPENFYKTAADMDAAIFAAYSPLIAGQNNLGKNTWITLDGGSDEAISNPVVPSAIVQAFGQLEFTPDQFRINNSWSEFYRTITRANIVIDRVPGIQAADDARSRLLAEAKFLRAFSYYYLVRLYGPVPLVTSEAQSIQKDVPRASVDEVYALILEDAQAAAAGLPEKWDARGLGRATRSAALTLLADVHLTRKDWQKAADYAKQVIDSGNHRLMDDFLAVFLPANENGPEMIFALQARDDPAAPSSSFMDFYFPREVGAGRGGGWAWIVANPWQVDSYLPGDYRREVTYETSYLNLNTGRVQTVDKPHIHKFRPSQKVNIYSGDLDIPIYRYAEVLLIYAEALNELGRPAEAVRYVNMVRARARNGNGAEPRAQPADLSVLGQAELREAIFQERRWELAHEGKRWFDLVRRGQEYWMSQLQANDPQAKPAPHKMLLPIPQTELAQNTALTQNPGY